MERIRPIELVLCKGYRPPHGYLVYILLTTEDGVSPSDVLEHFLPIAYTVDMSASVNVAEYDSKEQYDADYLKIPSSEIQRRVDFDCVPDN